METNRRQWLLQLLAEDVTLEHALREAVKMHRKVKHLEHKLDYRHKDTTPPAEMRRELTDARHDRSRLDRQVVNELLDILGWPEDFRLAAKNGKEKVKHDA